MKKSFLYMYAQRSYNRLVVAHEIKDFEDTSRKLQSNDILFLDDCLYSQYAFLKQYADNLNKRGIVCVLGFSTKIHRNEGAPMQYAVCAECHDKYHAGDMTALNAYMTVDEIKELLEYSNVYVACHGARHLKLESVSTAYLQMKMFEEDLQEAVDDLNAFGLSTNIFVFPYAYSDILYAYAILKQKGFYCIFAGKGSLRIQIEDLKNE